LTQVGGEDLDLDAMAFSQDTGQGREPLLAPGHQHEVQALGRQGMTEGLADA
jgi:hypothetical protein